LDSRFGLSEQTTYDIPFKALRDISKSPAKHAYCY
jgi:hypothetical protein